MSNIKYNKFRNNKIAIRNFNEAVDFHDLVKTLLVRMLRRSNPSTNTKIYTEHNVEEINDSYPDIQMIMELKGRKVSRIVKGKKVITSIPTVREIHVWELQEATTQKWQEKIIEHYTELGQEIHIISLKELRVEWMKAINSSKGKKEPIFHLRRLLEKYIV